MYAYTFGRLLSFGCSPKIGSIFSKNRPHWRYVVAWQHGPPHCYFVCIHNTHNVLRFLLVYIRVAQISLFQIIVIEGFACRIAIIAVCDMIL